jgi:hypothetical protein
MGENKILFFRKKHPAPAQNEFTSWSELVDDAQRKHSVGMKSVLGLLNAVGGYRYRVIALKSTPAEMLEFLMEKNDLKAADLPLPSSRVSEILAGKQGISKSEAKELGKFFHVSRVLFYEL